MAHLLPDYDAPNRRNAPLSTRAPRLRARQPGRGAAAPRASHTGLGGLSVAQRIDALIDQVAPCPWAGSSGAAHHDPAYRPRRPAPLYTPQERARRDATPWTLVQGILAPLQFAVFLVSLFLVMHYLITATGYREAAASVVVKTGVLYLIMITGSIWEKEVFGKWLFAPAFFWEDAVSMVVIALHTLYLAALWRGDVAPGALMAIALSAYATYAVNAAQFVYKLRRARLEGGARDDLHHFSGSGFGTAK